MNKTVRKFGRTALVAASVAAASAAQAAVDISTEVAAAKTDIGTAGALVLGVVLAVAAFTWIRRVIK